MVVKPPKAFLLNFKRTHTMQLIPLGTIMVSTSDEVKTYQSIFRKSEKNKTIECNFKETLTPLCNRRAYTRLCWMDVGGSFIFFMI
jgi:hypothetical protein